MIAELLNLLGDKVRGIYDVYIHIYFPLEKPSS